MHRNAMLCLEVLNNLMLSESACCTTMAFWSAGCLAVYITDVLELEHDFLASLPWAWKAPLLAVARRKVNLTIPVSNSYDHCACSFPTSADSNTVITFNGFRRDFLPMIFSGSCQILRQTFWTFQGARGLCTSAF